MREIAGFPFLTVMIRELCSCSGRAHGGSAQASIYAKTASFLAFKTKPSPPESRPSNKHTETFYIQPPFDVSVVLASGVHEVRGTGAICSERDGCFAHRRRETFPFLGEKEAAVKTKARRFSIINGLETPPFP